MAEVEMDSMECICGETLVGEKGKGQLWTQYQEHLRRPDHQSSPAQWAEAYERMVASKEKAKSAKSTES